MLAQDSQAGVNEDENLQLLVEYYSSDYKGTRETAYLRQRSSVSFN